MVGNFSTRNPPSLSQFHLQSLAIHSRVSDVVGILFPRERSNWCGIKQSDKFEYHSLSTLTLPLSLGIWSPATFHCLWNMDWNNRDRELIQLLFINHFLQVKLWVVREPPPPTDGPIGVHRVLQIPSTSLFLLSSFQFQCCHCSSAFALLSSVSVFVLRERRNFSFRGCC